MVELLAPNTALVPKGFDLSNAIVLRLGLFVPGVMPVTVPVVEVTPVTHVAAEAEDNSPALRLPTVSAERSVWFEADDNSANRTAARRGTIVCFGLVIPRPPEVWTCPE